MMSRNTFPEPQPDSASYPELFISKTVKPLKLWKFEERKTNTKKTQRKEEEKTIKKCLNKKGFLSKNKFKAKNSFTIFLQTFIFLFFI